MMPPADSPSTPPVVNPELAKQPPDLDSQNVPCLNCGYNLRGLQEDGRCPECGTPVERSLKGDLLIYSSMDHLASLHTGVFLILAGIILQILVVFGSIFAVIVISINSGGVGTSRDFEAVIAVINLGISFMMLGGWWLFSTPDPTILGTNTGSKARRAVRLTLAISAFLMVLDLVLQYALPLSLSTSIILDISEGADSVAMMVKFFAAMVYLRWLAPRLANNRIFKRAKLLMWLLPVLVITSVCTLFIGLLVALVLYWNLLDWVRRDLKQIRRVRLKEENMMPGTPN